MREALHERGVLLRNAPHLVHRRDFVVPAYRWLALPYYGIGLKIYDWMSGSLGLGRSRWLGRAEVVARMPAIRSEGLRGGILYTDGQFDDARLAITLARTLADLGGTALNYVKVIGFTKRDGRIAEVVARDAETGEEFRVEARSVINAAGVYVDAVRRLDEPGRSALVSPSQGAHLVLDPSFFPGETALLVPRTDDGRVLFAIPWHGRVLVGTTDTPVAERGARAAPAARRDRVSAGLPRPILQSLARPRATCLSIFAGLRPLLRGQAGEQTAKLSREHAVIVSDSGLVTITGGKWTTYRRMAVDAVDRAIKVGGSASRRPRPPPRSSCTAGGAERDGAVSLGRLWFRCAGSRRALRRTPGVEPAHSILRLPYLAGEAIWAARHEAARCVDDVLARRTRALFLDARAQQREGRAPTGRRPARSTNWAASAAVAIRVNTAEFKKLADIVSAVERRRYYSRSTPWDRSR